MTDLQVIQQRIFDIRGMRVMLDFHLAELYDIETRVLKQAVKRNLNRFPEDFMIELTQREWDNLRSQIVISSWGGSRYLPFAFTEQGVAMLSSVLRSDRAVEMNISIMRAFVMMRRMVAGYEELRERIEELEKQSEAQFEELYLAMAELLRGKQEASRPRNPIGFKQSNAQE
ncbi:MAG: ORF6N domain-containing protein [Rikenellaceae bacterium]|jgi:hypothetical protein|nr:ORF6N domain-containing protein [Rikenellaceae bacterium]